MSRYHISLAQWSLHRSIESGRIDPADFPRLARETFGIDTVELVNHLMPGADDESVRRLRRNAEDAGVQVLLIMCDDEGDFCAPSSQDRRRAAQNHFQWLDAARALQCHAVRVNTGPELPRDVDDGDLKRCAETLSMLLEYADRLELDVLLENHGGLSSDIDRLLRLLALVDHPRLGLLPDFGNFAPGVDRYEAIARMLPHARSLSVKCFDFDDTTGEEATFDLERMMALVDASEFRGFLGIEYEGERLDEYEGVRRAKTWLERWLATTNVG